MSRSPQVLYVAWQDPKTRRILPVGRVIVDAKNEFEFAYIHASEDATRLGFLPLLSYPDLQQTYRSKEILPLLRNRLLQKSRPDYVDYLEQLDLDASTAEPFTVLARSGGRRATDTLELFSPPSPTNDGRLKCVVFARGMRYFEGSEEVVSKLKPATQLQLIRDHTNQHNPDALKIRYNDVAIGYLPDYLVSELSCNLDKCSVCVLKVNLPPAPLHHRLLLEVIFPVSSPPPFSGRKYEPLSSDAFQFAA